MITFNFKYAIFDFDGVVADTENVFAQFDCDLLNAILKKAGKPPSLTPKDIRVLAGNTGENKLNLIAKEHNFSPEIYKEEFLNNRAKERTTLFKTYTVSLGKNLRPFLDQHTGKCALATNKIAKKLHNDMALMEIDHLFDIKITSDPPMRKKPEPDMLLEAAEKLQAKPSECIYIGDNTLDMLAAQNAGMIPVGFIIEGKNNHEDRAKDLKKHGATLIIDDFHELTPYFTSS
ncbi:MAG: HAD family hydrolase [Alphaproteobacteria bacterium]